MNIHEYQAKQLFAEVGRPVPAGVACHKEEEFAAAIDQIPGGVYVVKSQIHAGGRGKGTFTDGYKGGVQVTKSKEDALAAAKAMLGNTLVTKQTGPAGRVVRTIYFNEASSIKHEYYLAILLDRSCSKPVVIASTEGGMNIEEVAEKTPEKIAKVWIDPAIGMRAYQAGELAFALGFEGDEAKQFKKLVLNLYKLYAAKDCTLVEINPMVSTNDGKIVALDAKVSFDDNSLFRHPEIEALRDITEEDPKEVEARKYDLNYIALDGSIACLVNGAGLAMSTMDIIKYCGGSPANFLDVGGSATVEQVTAAFRIITQDPNVKGILVNIFGGIMSCLTIAEGIVAAAKTVEIKVPLVVRLEGNQVEEGKKVLAESGLKITPADSLIDGARKAVAEVNAFVAANK